MTSGPSQHASQYPVGVYPIPTGSQLAEMQCRQCKESYGITKWEHWNGFLTACPRCGVLNGKPWSFRTVLRAGLFFNAISFFFILRPRRAATVFFGFTLAAAVGIFMAVQFENQEWILITAILLLVLGPVVVNAVVLVRHQIDYDAAAQRPGKSA